MKKIIVTSLSSVFLLTSINAAYTATKLNQKDREFFYTTLFSSPDTDMFNDNENGITVNGKKLGEFRSSSRGLMTYLSVYQTFKEFTKLQDVYDDELIAKYAGVEPYQKGHENDQFGTFKYYNPDLIKWGTENLYIAPDTQIYGVKAKDIYDKSFKRFFRLTTESYLNLNNKKGMYKAEQKKYWDSFKNASKSEDGYFDGIDYLKKKYDTSLKAYNNEEFSYSPGIAAGFWLRRGLDKTDKILWQGLKKVMTNYDKEWFKKVSK